MPVPVGSEFDFLKRSVAKLAEAIDLQVLIRHFKTDINSNRRCSLIRSVSDLISVLEKRGLIDCDQFTGLKRILELLPDSEERNEILARLNYLSSRNAMQLEFEVIEEEDFDQCSADEQ